MGDLGLDLQGEGRREVICCTIQLTVFVKTYYVTPLGGSERENYLSILTNMIYGDDE